jgi:DNA-binding CsgD family transcriptional regulator
MLNRAKEAVLAAWDGTRRKSLRLSLRLRLFALLALFAAAIVLALASALSAAGVFSLGMNESRILLQSGLDHIAGNAETSYETLTAEGLALSGRLTDKIDAALKAEGVSASELKERPELLTGVLRNCVDPALAALERNRASGVFLILDATISPGTSSRAGFFFRNMEPNALTRSAPSIYFLRGPSALARERHINVLPQWLLEFPAAEGDFFHKAMEGADAELPLARTYYWNPAETLAGDYDDALLLCVPVVAADGSVLGVCGFEVNELLFKMQNLPDTSVWSGATAVFAPVMEDGSLDAGRAMFSGSHTPDMGGRLFVSDRRRGLSLFESGGARYVGLSAPVTLYGKNTVHGGEFAMALVVPESQLAAYAAAASRGVSLLLLAALALAVGLAAFLSKRYLAPVLAGLEQIKGHESEGFTPTNVPEIDDLLEYLAARDGERKAQEGETARLAAELEQARRQAAGDTGNGTPPAVAAAYGRFLQSLETLSAAERSVFNLYLDGKTAREIADELFITISTVKFHNGNIYRKLGVSSLKELKVYMGMMETREEGGGDTG